MNANSHTEPDGSCRRPLTFFAALLLIAFAYTSCTSAADEPAQASYFEQWQNEALLELEIETDLEQLFANQNEAAEQTANLTWKASATRAQIQADISVRGKTRREICDFPPLKLKLDKEQLQAQGFNADFRSLKLVTHCLAGNDELVLREYLIYKMLNELTDKSFRVQLARVTYRSNGNATEAYAFLIEDKDEMAGRLNGSVLESDQRELATIDAEQYRLLTVFAYMIGNTDWNLGKSHNIKLVQTADGGAPVPVPYDFDYSGLVNAPYANPHPQLPIQNVRQRFFQWRGASAQGLDETIGHFRTKKYDLYKVVQTFDYLDEASRRDMLQYLDEFYQSLPKLPTLAMNKSAIARSAGV